MMICITLWPRTFSGRIATRDVAAQAGHAGSGTSQLTSPSGRPPVTVKYRQWPHLMARDLGLELLERPGQDLGHYCAERQERDTGGQFNPGHAGSVVTSRATTDWPVGHPFTGQEHKRQARSPRTGPRARAGHAGRSPRAELNQSASQHGHCQQNPGPASNRCRSHNHTGLADPRRSRTEIAQFRDPLRGQDKEVTGSGRSQARPRNQQPPAGAANPVRLDPRSEPLDHRRRLPAWLGQDRPLPAARTDVQCNAGIMERWLLPTARGDLAPPPGN
jgi:hypothetical protein